MSRATTDILKALIGVLIGVLLATQIFLIPALASSIAQQYPEVAYLQAPAAAFAITFLGCVQVALIGVWRLLTMVRRDSIFADAAFLNVDVILGCIVLATMLVVAALILTSAADAVPPLLGIGLVFGIIIGTGLALLVTVLRHLLRKATQLERELDEVI